MSDTILKVPGMSCPSCSAHIEDVLGQLEGVSKVKILFGQREVVVRHDPDLVSRAALIAAMEAAGYLVAGVAP